MCICGRHCGSSIRAQQQSHGSGLHSSIPGMEANQSRRHCAIFGLIKLSPHLYGSLFLLPVLELLVLSPSLGMLLPVVLCLPLLEVVLVPVGLGLVSLLRLLCAPS